MDLKQLNYFVHVVELGSFTKAASLLFVAQSALSHRVRQLEVELKQVLLYRNGRGVTPTDAGKRVLEHARGILMQVNRVRDDLAETRDGHVGHVVLGLPVSVARLLTVTLFKAFRSAFPNATFGTVEGLSTPILASLVAGRIDIGMVYNAMPSPQIEILPLQAQELFLISPKAGRKSRQVRPVPTQHLPRYPLIIPSRANANRIIIEEKLAHLDLKPQIAIEIDGITSILDLVHEGYGHAILPLTSLRAHNLARDFVAVPIVNPKLTVQLSLVISAQRPTTPLTKESLALVRKTAMRVLFAEKS